MEHQTILTGIEIVIDMGTNATSIFYLVPESSGQVVALVALLLYVLK